MLQMGFLIRRIGFVFLWLDPQVDSVSGRRWMHRPVLESRHFLLRLVVRPRRFRMLCWRYRLAIVVSRLMMLRLLRMMSWLSWMMTYCSPPPRD